MFGLVFSRRKRVQIANARKMLEEVNGFAREEPFYKALSVPDTMTGRFDLISLVGALAVIRLNQIASKDSQILSQAFFDVMFRQFDYSLRESGVGDLSVPKHMKRMMKGFKGRTYAYDMGFVSGVNEDGVKLTDAEVLELLNRNLYANGLDIDSAELMRCRDVVIALSTHIMGLSDEDMLEGRFMLPSFDALNVEMKSAA